jgi:carnitine O-palmitoyltransferase 1, liver isoform
MRPLLDDKQYELVKQQSKEFERGIGKKLQRYLVLKSWWSSNYVSDWWEEYVYLRNRDSLLCGSNYYGSDLILSKSVKQTVRAANLIHLMLQFRRKIEHQELKPIMVQGLVPLCSSQYERMFNTARIPGAETDKLVHFYDIKHIVVLHKGCYYKVVIYHKNKLLNASEIQQQLDSIVNKAEDCLVWTNCEKNLAALTALNRTKWAEARQKFFSEGVNQTSLHEIESSAFVVVLDDDSFEYGLQSIPKEYGLYGRQLLHGKGNDRWLDKSFNLCVGKNGGVRGNKLFFDLILHSFLKQIERRQWRTFVG